MSPRPREHGTPEGYDAGCTSDVDCPAFSVHGMSCETAHLRFITSERRYMILRGRGLTSTQIAHQLGFTVATSAQRAVEAAHPVHRDALARRLGIPTPTTEETDMPTPNDAAKTSKHLTADPVVDAPVDTTPAPAKAKHRKKKTKPKLAAAAAGTPSQSEVRAWARDRGLDVNPRGSVKAEIMTAYLEAHRDNLTPDAAQPLAESSQDPDPLGMPSDEPETEEDAPGDVPDAEDEEMGHHSTHCKKTYRSNVGGQDVVVWCPRLPDHDGDCGPFYNPAEWEHLTPEEFDAAAARVLEIGSDPITDDEFAEALEQIRARLDTEPPAPDTDTRAEDTTPTTPDTERPEWGDVAAAEDVESARRIAVRLEQELAETERQLTEAIADAGRYATELEQAQNAVEVVLRKWDADRTAHHAAIEKLRVDLLAASSTANLWAGLYRSAEEEAADLKHERAAALADACRAAATRDAATVEHRPWWKRASA